MDKVFRSIRFTKLPGRYVVPFAGEGGGAVNSVNGQQGNVILTAEDVGAVDAQKVSPATPEDTQEVHIDFNGKLLTKPTGGGANIVPTPTRGDERKALVVGREGRYELESRGYVTPEMFGAKGDGATDDTVAIQTAINYGGNNEVDILLPGAYSVTSTLDIPEPVSIFASKTHETISYSGSGPLFNLSAADTRGTTIDGIRAGGNVQSTFLNIPYVSTGERGYMRFSNCYVYGFGTGVHASAGYYSRVENCGFNNGNVAIRLDGHSGNWAVDNCAVRNMSESAAIIEGEVDGKIITYGNGNVFQNCTFENCDNFIHQIAGTFTKVVNTYMGDGCRVGVIIDKGDLSIVDPVQIVCGASESAVKLADKTRFSGVRCTFARNGKTFDIAGKPRITLDECTINDYSVGDNAISGEFFSGEDVPAFGIDLVDNAVFTAENAVTQENGKNRFGGKAYDVYNATNEGYAVNISMPYKVPTRMVGKTMALVFSFDTSNKDPLIPQGSDFQVRVYGVNTTSAAWADTLGAYMQGFNDPRVYQLSDDLVYFDKRDYYICPFTPATAEGAIKISLNARGATAENKGLYLGRWEYAYLTTCGNIATLASGFYGSTIGGFESGKAQWNE